MEMYHFTLAAFLVTIVAATTPWKKEKVDFIVVGAGASGAAVAARLSENPENEVALLEAGGEAPFVTKIPYFSIGPFKGDVDWDFITEKQEAAFLNYVDQKAPYPRGKGLGGSTLINAVLFTRGSRHDYDNWASLGNEGWDYDSVLPYFRKLENYEVPLRKECDESFHNQGGPVNLAVPPYRTPFADVFLAAGEELGYKVVDYDAKTMTGVSNPVFSIRNATRCSTNEAYIVPARNRSNFHVITHAFVTKIRFDTTQRATGVMFLKDGKEWYLEARKEVILSAGSLKSPQILMLSGVGPKATLDKFKIPVVSDLPGVGENLQDHVSTNALLFSVDKNVGFKPDGDVSPENLELWERKRQGPLTVPVRCEGISFVKTKYSDADKDHPDVEIIMTQPPFPKMPFDPKVTEVAFAPEFGKDLLSLMPILLRPKSRGYVTLQSNDPLVPAVFQPNFLTHDDDIKVLLEGIKIALKLGEAKAFQKYGTKWLKRKLPGCEIFNDFDDSYWECAIRHYTIHFFHQSGTCQMGSNKDKMAVVDSKLKVHGVSGLRVVDTSIFPRITSGHTMAPAIMVGEKAADLIKGEWQQKRDEL